MRIERSSYPLVILLTLATLLSPFFVYNAGTAEAASQRTLAWSVVDTPADNSRGMILRTVGINAFAMGPDSKTFYAVDTANNGFYKSTDSGYSWLPFIRTNLILAGATMPVWDIIVSPDDANIILAVTDGSGAPSGPKNMYFSSDGGGTWVNTGLAILPNEYISCVAASKQYGTATQARDIAVGTRNSAGAGRLLTRQYSNTWMGGWVDQLSFPQLGVTSVKFSPSYNTDQTIAVISCTAANMILNLGKHDSSGNTTIWNVPGGYPNYPVTLSADNAATILYSNIELPSDYVGSDLSLRNCFISLAAQNSSSVVYVNNSAITYTITPPITAGGVQKIRSLAYSGFSSSGTLMASEMTSNPSSARVNVWKCLNAQVTSPNSAVWSKSDYLKSPTGGGNTGRANALLSWGSDFERIYCGTSGDNTTVGGVGTIPGTGQWPFSQLVGAPLDESAFSYSWELEDVAIGNIWNQIGIVNTQIDNLSDAAANEPSAEVQLGHSTLYLASLNENTTVPNSFDSVWRSTSDTLGQKWERVLISRSSDNGIILRVNPRDSASRTTVVFADLFTDNITYSDTEGDLWTEPHAGTRVCDISLLNDTTMYVLSDYTVRKITSNDNTWKIGPLINTGLMGPGHTISTPLAASSSITGKTQEIVIVGTGGNYDSVVGWCDYNNISPKFTSLEELPQRGDVHVVLDAKFPENKFIYAGLNTLANNGVIYRWSLGKSVKWDELEPSNMDFFGLATLNDVFYGTWHVRTASPPWDAGADRTLYARQPVPPPPEWDELIAGLPPLVQFTRQPSALQLSTNDYNTLWAIDNRPYTFDNSTGCLWMYIDSMAKLGPWPTSPAPGALINPDTVSGRGKQLDFKWRPLRDVFGYDLLIAKDINFTLLLTQNLQMTPVDNNTGAWVVTPADQTSPSCWISPGVLEVGRSYYWKVRGSRAIGGERVHSPWSQTMFFSFKPGFAVTSDHPGPTLLEPKEGPCFNCKPPIRFSWGPIEGTQKYEFVLANDAQLNDIVAKAITETTGYEYKDKLKLSKPYFWQVKALEPVPSDPSPVGTFTLSENKTTAQKTPAKATKPGGVPAPSGIWIWVIIVIVAVLLLLINAYVFISRRRDD